MNLKLLVQLQVLIFPKDFPNDYLSSGSLWLWGSIFFPDFKRCRFIFLAAVCCSCSLVKYISSARTRPFTIVERRKKKVEFRVCILRINNCRKKSSCSTAVWLMSKGTETNLALSSRLFLVSQSSSQPDFISKIWKIEKRNKSWARGQDEKQVMRELQNELYNVLVINDIKTYYSTVFCVHKWV